MKETIAKINKTKFFENTNKIDKLLARLIKKKKKGEKSNQHIINEKGEVTAEQHRNTKDHRRIL